MIPPAPASDLAQSADLMRAFVKATVIEIVEETGKTTLGVRLPGVVAGTADGRTQIRTAGGTITIAAVAELKDGARVTLTLQRTGDGLVARLQPASPTSPSTSTSSPALAANAATEPHPTPGSKAGVAPAPSLPPIQPPHRAPLAWSIEAAVPTAGPPNSRPQEEASPPPTAGTRTGSSMAVPNDDGTQRLARFGGQSATAPTETGKAAANDPAAPQPKGLFSAGGRYASPIDTDRQATAVTPATISTAAAVREPASQLRPLPSVDLATLVDLLQSTPEDPTTNRFKSTPLADAPARPTHLDVERFATSFAHLAEAHPALARSLLSSALPQPDGTLGKILSSFVAALGNNDPTTWLGQNLEARISSVSPAFADQLSSLVDDRSRPATSVHAGWREAELPLLTPTGLLPMRVLVEEKPDDQDAEKPEPRRASPTRLILECTLSQFERTQLDTLVRKPKRCDVIVRSTIPLPRDVQALVTRSFLGIGDETGLAGTISFQSAPAGFVDPSPPSRAGDGIRLST